MAHSEAKLDGHLSSQPSGSTLKSEAEAQTNVAGTKTAATETSHLYTSEAAAQTDKALMDIHEISMDYVHDIAMKIPDDAEDLEAEEILDECYDRVADAYNAWLHTYRAEGANIRARKSALAK